MLDSFFVSNFRLFKRFELPKLGRVNLIVGRNGSGKSALLEAIHMYASNGNLSVLADSIYQRLERSGPGNVFRHLFYGHQLPDYDGEGIRVGISPATNIHITLAAYQVSNNSGELIGNLIKVKGASADALDIYPYLIVDDGKTISRITDFGERFQEYRKFHASLNLHDSHNVRIATQKISTQIVNTNQLALLWDKQVFTDLEADVISGLQLMMPDIQGLTFVEEKNDEDTKERVPLVRLIGSKEPRSLKSMGDGIYRLLHIILTLVNAKDGILLIDELENGLHWKIHSKVWNIVFSLSKKLNVQVFVTTHSGDCIRGYETAWKERIDEGVFFRLDVKNDNVKATYYNHETLYDALVADVEVR